MSAPSPEDVRLALADFDLRRQKIVTGLFALMIRNPERVRDRDWISRQLAEVVVLAGEFEADSPEAGLREVETFLRDNAEELLTATYLLFQRVGLDLAPRADEGIGYEELSALQNLFIQMNSFQCGFCAPGIVLSATELLQGNPNPTRHDVQEALAGNLCRCTGYEPIIDAVLAGGEGGDE